MANLWDASANGLKTLVLMLHVRFAFMGCILTV